MTWSLTLSLIGGRTGVGRLVASIGVLIVVLAAVPQVTDAAFVLLATEAIVFAIFALSFYPLLAYAGLLSFGHAAFLGVGAYTEAMLLARYSQPLWIAFVAAPLFSAAVAFVVGWFCVRLTRLYFAMLTMAFAQLLWAIAFKWHYLGAADGIVGIPPHFLGGMPDRLYYFAAFSLVVVFSIVRLVGRSPYGLTLQAIRDNPTRSEFVGLHVRRMRLSAFVLAGGLAGLAGALLAVMNRVIFPDVMYWTMSGEVLIMVLLGGSGSIWGAVVGAVVLTFLRKYISEIVTAYWELILGAILALVVLYMPGGLTGFAGRVAAAVDRYLSRGRRLDRVDDLPGRGLERSSQR